ncbi:MAG: formimidoylglutamate deiminase [Betaproteobacteria bacterium]|nr:formimidoylglutamate deiminase [Betaproteobacteria bacterium]
MIFHAPHALLPEGWRRDVLLEVGPSGDFVSVSRGAAPAGAWALAGPVLPGFTNLHSHAFQRALLGRTQIASGSGDSFWTWREAMYGLVAALDEEDYLAIAAQNFAELVRGGYTTVCEFHYLHRGAGGVLTEPPERYARLLVEAARDAGIALTLLPVLYMRGDFAGQPLSSSQERFRGTPEMILRGLEALRSEFGGASGCRIGVAPHSLRAVPPAALQELIAGVSALDAGAPIHIHVAEQQREVEDCIGALGQRPVAWLFDHMPVDQRWCLVHATHLAGAERELLARSGAVAGLCPSTEGDLGDGFFPLREFLKDGGCFGIGSDSNLGADPFEELRWLEYGQRLRIEGRNVAALDAGQSTGAMLVQKAHAGGARAAGQPVGALQVGKRADFLVLNPAHRALLGLSPEHWLDALVFSSGAESPITDVYVAGHAVVREGRHQREKMIAQRFAKRMARLGLGA